MRVRTKQSWFSIARPAALALSLLLSACSHGGGGDDGGGSTPDTTPPSVSATSPPADSTGVAVSSTVSATFSEPVDPATLSTSTFSLNGPNGPVAGSVSVSQDGTIATFTPSAGLSKSALYTATITTGVTDEAGNPISADYPWSFTTLNKKWDPAAAEPIESGSGSAPAPQVAFDAAGNAMAVWSQSDGTRDNIWARRYAAGSVWGTAVLIETDNAGSAIDPRVAMNAVGDAMAVWQQFDGTRFNIWANRYAAGSGWQGALKIETDDAGDAAAPQVAMDGLGNAIAVWYQDDGTPRFNILANRYTAGTGWGMAALPLESSTDDASYPQIAMNSSGIAFVVWYQIVGGARADIWSNRYASGSWDGTVLIETNDAGTAYFPRIGVNASGNAIAVWTQNDGSIDNPWIDSTWSNRYVAGIGWGDAELIEFSDLGTTDAARVAMDSSGNAIAIWAQNSGFGMPYDIWSSRYVAGIGWETAVSIETNAGDISFPQLAMDSSGNAIAVWLQLAVDVDNVWANRYGTGVGWGTAELIEANPGDANAPQIAVDSDGNAMAVWSQDSGFPLPYDIWSNRFE